MCVEELGSLESGQGKGRLFTILEAVGLPGGFVPVSRSLPVVSVSGRFVALGP